MLIVVEVNLIILILRGTNYCPARREGLYDYCCQKHSVWKVLLNTCMEQYSFENEAVYVCFTVCTNFVFLFHKSKLQFIRRVFCSGNLHSLKNKTTNWNDNRALTHLCLVMGRRENSFQFSIIMRYLYPSSFVLYLRSDRRNVVSLPAKHALVLQQQV